MRKIISKSSFFLISSLLLFLTQSHASYVGYKELQYITQTCAHVALLYDVCHQLDALSGVSDCDEFLRASETSILPTQDIQTGKISIASGKTNLIVRVFNDKPLSQLFKSKTPIEPAAITIRDQQNNSQLNAANGETENLSVFSLNFNLHLQNFSQLFWHNLGFYKEKVSLHLPQGTDEIPYITFKQYIDSFFDKRLGLQNYSQEAIVIDPQVFFPQEKKERVYLLNHNFQTEVYIDFGLYGKCLENGISQKSREDIPNRI